MPTYTDVKLFHSNNVKSGEVGNGDEMFPAAKEDLPEPNLIEF